MSDNRAINETNKKTKTVSGINNKKHIYGQNGKSSVYK